MSETYPFTLRPLPYPIEALEPYIDKKTMYIHHDKLTSDYVDHLNQLLSNHPELHNMTLDELIRTAFRLPSSIGIPLSRSASGVYNHYLYFDSMTPNQKSQGSNAFLKALDKYYGSFQNFRDRFTQAAMSVFGSGYAWLVCGRRGPAIMTLSNQGNPIAAGQCPIMCLDVWEHSYFLMYYNKRVEYIGDWWGLVNWEYINERYTELASGYRRADMP